MIKSFACKKTKPIWEGTFVKGYSLEIQNITRRKLRMLNNAYSLNDLKIPPANRLEALSGDKIGEFSIRVNQQWRLCFKWGDPDVFDVYLIDYH